MSDNHDTAARPGRRPGGVGEPAPAASGAKPRGTDRVSLRGLRVTGYHGVFDFEREAGQDFVIDADLAVRTEPAARWDDLTQTVDYSTLAQRLAEVVAGEPCNLIETLAARLAAAALQDTGVEAVTITVHKPQAPIDGLTFEDVTVSVTRDRSSVRLGVLSLGSNLGDRLAHLQAGVDALAATPGVVVRKVSPVYETDPVGVPGEQPQYLNAAVLVETALNPRDLLGVARRVENLRGRERPERYAARTLDVDLIALGDEESDDPNLTLPHPRAFERGFVLAPWLAVQPEAELPGYGRVAVQLARVGSEGLERRDDLPLHLPGA